MSLASLYDSHFKKNQRLVSLHPKNRYDKTNAATGLSAFLGL